ncbi:MAG: aromatic aminobenezylarsenical efflux permease ArsG family transporter [Bryobacteraceae bacterium]|nr:aromatic aminobenezylarsenical efflux permease ArsG family transporter [Bryobacteraceae bacterium]
MPEILFAGGVSLWLGVLTSVSPCPLATNIAAVSYIGKGLESAWRVFAAGALYTAGRTLTYLALAGLVVASVLSIPQASYYLQTYMNKLLGPVLILVGMALTGLLNLGFSVSVEGGGLQKKFSGWGLWGAGLLGMLFALSFCPVSAAVFFGSLIPLALQHESAVILPGMYGIGTGLPVVAFAALIAGGARSVSRAFERVTQAERWARPITGAVFIVVGVYLSLTHIFEVF